MVPTRGTGIVVALAVWSWSLATLAQDVRDDFSLLQPREGAPSAFRLASDVDVSPEDFFSDYRGLFELGPDDEMIAVSDVPWMGTGDRITRMVQHHHGYPVIGGDVVLIHRDGRVRAGVGRVVPLGNGRPRFAVRQSDAEAAALAEIGRAMGLPPREVESNSVEVELVLAPEGGRVRARDRYRYAYRFTIGTKRPLGRTTVDVDGEDGAILHLVDEVDRFDVDGPATGQSLHDGTVDFTALVDDTLVEPPVLETIAPAPIVTRDYLMLADADVASPYLGTMSGNVASFDGPDDAAGVTAHWSVQKTFAYFWQHFGWIGVDGEGAVTLENRVNWDNQNAVDMITEVAPGVAAIRYGNANGEPFVALDVVGHEVSHGVMRYLRSQSYFVKAGEPGALAESFADIFGSNVEDATLGPADAWIAGEDVFGGVPARRLDSPKSLPLAPGYDPQPNTYLGDLWGDTSNPDKSNDNGHVHTNAGVQNFWYYLLAEGGQGTVDDKGNDAYEVQGIGRDRATAIVLANIQGLPAAATFQEARDLSIDAAIALYCEHSQEHVSTENAWHAVGLGLPYPSTLYTSPADGEQDVEPWRASFYWEVGPDETDWEIELSTTSDFSADTQIIPYWDVVFDANLGKDVARQSVTLRPDTTYFWRVRANEPDGGPLCPSWRPARAFRTRPKVTTPLGPTGGGARDPHGPFHPWRLPFTWEHTGGVDHYEIQVASDPGFQDLIVETTAKNLATTADLDVRTPKNVAPHYWRIRPHGLADDPSYAGAWSAPVTFETSMPEVNLAEPADGTLVYPWGLALRWESILGAQKYILELTKTRDGFKAGGEVVSIPIPAPAEPQPAIITYEVDLVPELTTDNVKHWWRVRVVGPKPFDDEGDPSDEWHVLNDGSATTPTSQEVIDCWNCVACNGDCQDPACIAECPPTYVAYGADVTLSWMHVPLAEQYLVTLYPFMAGGGHFWVDFDSPFYSQTYPRDDAGPSQSATFDGALANTPATGSKVYGVWHTVQAIGPAGMSPTAHQTDLDHPLEPNTGSHLGDWEYYLVAPEVFASGAMMEHDPYGFVFAEGTEADPFVWASFDQGPIWSPTGLWEYRVYDDLGCSDLVFEEASPGALAVGWPPEAEGSFRVRARGEYYYFYAGGWGWSPCLDVQMASLDAHEKKNCGNGVEDPYEECDDGNTADGDGCSADCQDTGPPPSPCNELVQAGSEEGGTFSVDLGDQPGDFWFVWDTVNIPDQLTLTHNNNPLHDTGCIGTQAANCQGPGCGGAEFIAWSGQGPSNIVTVTVSPNCANQNGVTEWAFVVTCPVGGPAPVANPADESP